ncbi:SH3 domain-containing protein [Salinisphaera sp. RV14]|uniref:SH3 domain-containing protein n=1 Tax=unclassified Salinisphaera TaxID=2649847 RepID=UPI003F870361
MRVRVDARFAIVIAVTLAAAPGVVWAAGRDAPSADRAQQILDQNRPLAKNGDASAQYNMGVLYDRGYGVKRDYAKARHWYEKAAAQHYARAEHNLGIMYEAGKGVPRDPAKAAHWFRRGADDGQTASQNNLAVLYMKGQGVPQNTGKAAFWAARAAAGGNRAAIDNLPRIIAGLPHVYVNADHVNVRAQPDRKSRVVGHADRDTVAVVLSRRNDWTQILLPDDDTLGWVANFLLPGSQGATAGNAAPAQDTSNAGGAVDAATDATTPAASDSAAADRVASANKVPAKSTRPETKPPRLAAGGDSLVVDHRQQPARSTPGKEVAPKSAPDRKSSVPPTPAVATPHQHAPVDQALPKTAGAGNGGGGGKPEAGGSAAATPPAAKSGSSGSLIAKPKPEPKPKPKPAPKTKATEPAATAKPSPARASTATHATVGVDAINVRAKARRGSRVVGQLHRGDRVKLLEEHNGWRYVRTAGGMKGWVAGYLLVMP